jgi:hypothetical protein
MPGTQTNFMVDPAHAAERAVKKISTHLTFFVSLSSLPILLDCQIIYLVQFKLNALPFDTRGSQTVGNPSHHIGNVS